MNITQNSKDGHQSFQITDEGAYLGEMSYRIAAQNQLIIEHTFIDPKLRGQDFGMKLLTKIANFAKENKYKLQAECPYAAKLLERNHETFKDII